MLDELDEDDDEGGSEEEEGDSEDDENDDETDELEDEDEDYESYYGATNIVSSIYVCPYSTLIDRSIFHLQSSTNNTNGDISFVPTLENGDSDSLKVVDSVSSFLSLKKPTEAQFKSLPEKDKVGAFRDYLKVCVKNVLLSNTIWLILINLQAFPENDFLINSVFTIMKVSSIAANNTEAQTVVIELYKDCFAFARKTNQTARVYRFLLIQLGLLKCEDKTFRPAYDVAACRSALRQAIKANVIPSEAADILNCFLNENK